MFVLVGVSHRSAPVDLRERMAFPGGDLHDALGRLTGGDGIAEAMILSTCNRVEILCRVDDVNGGLEEVRRLLVEERGVAADDLLRYGYHHTGRDAVSHLIRVASGLDSLVLGEPQILGQVKQAYAASKQSGTIGPFLDHLVRQSLSAAKRIRSNTGISRHAVSIASTSVQLARKIFGDLSGRRALLLGAGKMGGMVAVHLASAGIHDVDVASRTFAHATAFAAEHGASACRWDDAFDRLASADIVVSGTAAAEPVLSREAVQAAMKARRSKPLFIIDIAVPRDVDPEVNNIDNVYLYDIDDLQGVADSGLEERKRAAMQAEALVAEEVDRFERWLGSLEVTPVIVSLREELHGVGAGEFVRFRRRLGDLTREQEEQVANLVRSVVQKILHRPILHLKGAAEKGEAGTVSDLYGKIFGIGPAGSEDEE